MRFRACSWSWLGRTPLPDLIARDGGSSYELRFVLEGDGLPGAPGRAPETAPMAPST